MFGHLLPAFSNVAPLELPLLAATAASTWWIIGIAFTLIACGSTYGYLRRQKKSAAKPTPAPQTRTPVRSPFDELVEAHKLDDSEVGLLRQAVQQLELEQPILLFVDPALLARFCEANSDADALRQKLFGSPADAEQPDSGSSDQPCSDLQTESPEASQAEVDPGTSIDAVVADLLGDLPSADIMDSTGLPTLATAEQPIDAVSAS